jgi:hypothetical protein
LETRPNWKSSCQISILTGSLSLGGETHPLRGWGRTPQAGSPTPTPRGFTRVARFCLRTSRPQRTSDHDHCPACWPGARTCVPTRSRRRIGAGDADIDLGTTAGWAMRLSDGTQGIGGLEYRSLPLGPGRAFACAPAKFDLGPC